MRYWLIIQLILKAVVLKRVEQFDRTQFVRQYETVRLVYESPL
jgi:hypothetical protein